MPATQKRYTIDLTKGDAEFIDLTGSKPVPRKKPRKQPAPKRKPQAPPCAMRSTPDSHPTGPWSSCHAGTWCARRALGS